MSSPHFPPELEKVIFQLAAASTPRWRSISPLHLVARRVTEWIEPFRFRTMSFGVRRTATARTGNSLQLAKLKTPLFLAQNVRNVLIDAEELEDTFSIIEQFTGIRALALGPWGAQIPFPNFAVYPNLRYLFLGRGLSVPFCEMLASTPSLTLPITHLRFSADGLDQLVPFIHNRLQSLTHLSISAWIYYCPLTDHTLNRVIALEQLVVVELLGVFNRKNEHATKQFPTLLNSKARVKLIRAFEDGWDLITGKGVKEGYSESIVSSFHPGDE
ncbi:hypothetical protein DL96DRAFT_1653561 [Flagelloscypha sp. PMI_526]|nr:hypothetical protein DL96DRAFT_1653561 [Flagelloscypha sp. PMI_526]